MLETVFSLINRLSKPRTDRLVFHISACSVKVNVLFFWQGQERPAMLQKEIFSKLNVGRNTHLPKLLNQKQKKGGA